ncbi:MAG: hypothetical protein AAF378_23250 [Cyanobacteria bacterium P01_A01_bin.84]
MYRECNKVILSDSRFNLNINTIEHPVVYPRLIISVTETAIAFTRLNVNRHLWKKSVPDVVLLGLGKYFRVVFQTD